MLSPNVDYRSILSYGLSPKCNTHSKTNTLTNWIIGKDIKETNNFFTQLDAIGLLDLILGPLLKT